jgi:hypothetical protein
MPTEVSDILFCDLSLAKQYVKEIPDSTIGDLSTRYPEVVFKSWLKKNADNPF